jgi:tetratricopeptide (TPR) repeat protein
VFIIVVSAASGIWSRKMSFSRVGILAVLLITAFLGANCAQYNRVIARKNLVDGGQAYKDRKFPEAEQHFRNAIERDPELQTEEGRMAQLFLARTLHSGYIGNRQEPARAEAAIQEYKKILEKDINDQSSFNAVANLLENLKREDEWLQWITARANNEQVKGEQRAEAITKLAARKYSCANDVSDLEPVKKTVTKGEKAEYVFSKPEDPQVFAQFRQCVDEGLELTARAVKLDPNSEPAWSYRANMLVQQMRLAEMDGDKARADSVKAEADQAKESYTALSTARREKEQQEEERKKAAEEAANTKP